MYFTLPADARNYTANVQPAGPANEMSAIKCLFAYTDHMATFRNDHTKEITICAEASWTAMEGNYMGLQVKGGGTKKRGVLEEALSLGFGTVDGWLKKGQTSDKADVSAIAHHLATENALILESLNRKESPKDYDLAKEIEQRLAFTAKMKDLDKELEEVFNATPPAAAAVAHEDDLLDDEGNILIMDTGGENQDDYDYYNQFQELDLNNLPDAQEQATAAGTAGEKLLPDDDDEPHVGLAGSALDPLPDAPGAGTSAADEKMPAAALQPAESVEQAEQSESSSGSQLFVPAPKKAAGSMEAMMFSFASSMFNPQGPAARQAPEVVQEAAPAVQEQALPSIPEEEEVCLSPVTGLPHVENQAQHGEESNHAEQPAPAALGTSSLAQPAQQAEDALICPEVDTGDCELMKKFHRKYHNNKEYAMMAQALRELQLPGRQWVEVLAILVFGGIDAAEDHLKKNGFYPKVYNKSGTKFHFETTIEQTAQYVYTVLIRDVQDAIRKEGRIGRAGNADAAPAAAAPKKKPYMKRAQKRADVLNSLAAVADDFGPGFASAVGAARALAGENQPPEVLSLSDENSTFQYCDCEFFWLSIF